MPWEDQPQLLLAHNEQAGHRHRLLEEDRGLQ